MSHSVTVRTTTTTSGSAILLNTGYLKSPPGILKILQVILGTICVGLLASVFNTNETYRSNIWTPELFFLLMATTFLIATTLLLFACLISFTTSTILPKTIFEVVYHVVAAILIIVSAGFYLIRTIDLKRYIYSYDQRFATGVLGIVNAILYAVALFFSCRHYRNM